MRWRRSTRWGWLHAFSPAKPGNGRSRNGPASTGACCWPRRRCASRRARCRPRSCQVSAGWRWRRGRRCCCTWWLPWTMWMPRPHSASTSRPIRHASAMHCRATRWASPMSMCGARGARRRSANSRVRRNLPRNPSFPTPPRNKWSRSLSPEGTSTLAPRPRHPPRQRMPRPATTGACAGYGLAWRCAWWRWSPPSSCTRAAARCSTTGVRRSRASRSMPPPNRRRASMPPTSPCIPTAICWRRRASWPSHGSSR